MHASSYNMLENESNLWDAFELNSTEHTHFRIMAQRFTANDFIQIR